VVAGKTNRHCLNGGGDITPVPSGLNGWTAQLRHSMADPVAGGRPQNTTPPLPVTAETALW
jgi:hypothetical protein